LEVSGLPLLLTLMYWTADDGATGVSVTVERLAG